MQAESEASRCASSFLVPSAKMEILGFTIPAFCGRVHCTAPGGRFHNHHHPNHHPYLRFRRGLAHTTRRSAAKLFNFNSPLSTVTFGIRVKPELLDLRTLGQKADYADDYCSTEYYRHRRSGDRPYKMATALVLVVIICYSVASSEHRSPVPALRRRLDANRTRSNLGRTSSSCDLI
jgi:hypothetical protein